MALSFLFLLVRRVIELNTRDPAPEHLRQGLEILVLRHQLKVLKRKAPRPRFNWADRAFLSLAARLLPRVRWSSFLVTPATVLEWQRKIVRRRWTYKNRPGRPPLQPETVELICRVARENRRWGYLPRRGRAEEAGGHRVSDGGAWRPAPPRPRAGAPADRPELGRVPAGTGGEHAGDGLLPH